MQRQTSNFQNKFDAKITDNTVTYHESVLTTNNIELRFTRPSLIRKLKFLYITIAKLNFVMRYDMI